MPDLTKIDVRLSAYLFHELAFPIALRLGEKAQGEWQTTANNLHKAGVTIAQRIPSKGDHIGRVLIGLHYLEAEINKKSPEGQLETRVFDVAAELLPKYAKANLTAFESVNNWLRQRCVTPEHKRLHAHALLQAFPVLLETNQLRMAALALEQVTQACDLPAKTFDGLKGQCGPMRVSVREVPYTSSQMPDDTHLMLAVRKSGSGGRAQFAYGWAEGEQAPFLTEVTNIYDGTGQVARNNCQVAATAMTKIVSGNQPLGDFRAKAEQRLTEALKPAEEESVIETPAVPSSPHAKQRGQALKAGLGS